MRIRRGRRYLRFTASETERIRRRCTQAAGKRRLQILKSFVNDWRAIMALTAIKQLLINYLEISRAGEPDKTLAYLAMDTEDQMLEMCHYLSDNPEATGQQILTEARRIAGEET